MGWNYFTKYLVALCDCEQHLELTTKVLKDFLITEKAPTILGFFLVESKIAYLSIVS